FSSELFVAVATQAFRHHDLVELVHTDSESLQESEEEEFGGLAMPHTDQRERNEVGEDRPERLQDFGWEAPHHRQHDGIEDVALQPVRQCDVPLTPEIKEVSR